MSDHNDDTCRCPHCEALEQRVVELERRLADRDAAARESMAEPKQSFSLRALKLLDHGWGEDWELRPAPPRRAWMDAQPHAYQCLPMVVANQWGWQILCPTDVRATWDGSDDSLGLWVEVDPKYAPAIKTQFGRGILTFSPPWLFRTPPGWDLLAKGPTNRWKENCTPLEGIIETWWLKYTFTLNWKLIQPGSVTFAKGESLGQLIPIPHETFKESSACELPVQSEPGTAEELLRWRDERRRIKYDPVVVHRLYRKAEDVPDHVVRVPVPPVNRAPPGTPPQTEPPRAHKNEGIQ
jgi:hypothetical protein